MPRTPEPQVGIEPTTAPLSIVRGNGVSPVRQRRKAEFLRPLGASTAPFTVATSRAKCNRSAIRRWAERQRDRAGRFWRICCGTATALDAPTRQLNARELEYLTDCLRAEGVIR